MTDIERRVSQAGKDVSHIYGMLEHISGVQTGHTVTLHQQTELLNSHTQVLNENTGLLEQHGSRLDNHRRILDIHTTMLQRILDKLEGGTND